jgi:hypothetical protein
VSDFYGPASPPVLGDPRLDPPMTCRVESWERRFDPTVRRAILTAPVVVDHPWPWVIVTGPAALERWLSHDEVADWPVAHPITYCAAFRHSSTESAPAQDAERGDMTVEAFRTPRDRTEQ